ncbi:MAG: hypothetical protein U0807_19055 [Candidatus Binatia bacterium]
MRAFAHRACALLVVLALLAAAPLTTQPACDRCPSGCPMHHRPKQQLPCHHGGDAVASRHATSDDGAPCVRPSGCGHAPMALPVVLRAIVAGEATVAPAIVSHPLVPARVTSRSLDSDAPPHGPPRSLPA